MSESTCHEAMYRFCEDVIAVFSEYYLRELNMDGIARFLSINESRGFSGMLGSIDCMHWQWKNYPFSWQWQFKRHKKGCTIILEAVASQDLWIWHSFFGMAGSKMISMCCIALRYFLGLTNALLLKFSMRSMVTLMIRVII
jgi:hypothetical protein